MRIECLLINQRIKICENAFKLLNDWAELKTYVISSVEKMNV
jgi:hypothetical protein